MFTYCNVWADEDVYVDLMFLLIRLYHQLGTTYSVVLSPILLSLHCIMSAASSLRISSSSGLLMILFPDSSDIGCDRPLLLCVHPDHVTSPSLPDSRQSSRGAALHHKRLHHSSILSALVNLRPTCCRQLAASVVAVAAPAAAVAFRRPHYL